jgi:DnaJ-class molecular chaperone
MLVQFFKKITTIARTKYSFATAATRDRVGYYRILEVEEGATEQAIRAAYAELTKGIVPEHDYERFRELNEAFVILSDNKTRDAYDSLLSVRKSNYLSPE